MLESDPAIEDERLDQYECPRCGHRVEAAGSVCCADCGVEMENLGKPRHW